MNSRYIGASSMWAWRFAKMQNTAVSNGWTTFVSMQDQYNLLQREEEREMFGLLADQGVGSIPWSPLAAGQLTRPWGELGTTRAELNPANDMFATAVPRQRSASRERSSEYRRGSRCLDGAGRIGLGVEKTRWSRHRSSAPPSRTTFQMRSPHSTSSSPRTRSPPSRSTTPPAFPRGFNRT